MRQLVDFGLCSVAAGLAPKYTGLRRIAGGVPALVSETGVGSRSGQDSLPLAPLVLEMEMEMGQTAQTSTGVSSTPSSGLRI